MAAAALTAAFVAFHVPAHAQATPPPASNKTNSGKIGVAPLGAPGLSAELRLKLEDAAAAGLRASGAEVVSSSDLSRARSTAALGACTDSACEQKLAQLTDTRYWLRGTVALDTSTYRIHLELTDARAGSILTARDDTCDICTEADAIEAVNMAASTLKAAAAKTTPAVAPAAAMAATETTDSGTTGPGPGPASTDAVPDEASAQRPTWLRVLPWVAFAGAAAALTTGIYLWSIDGRTETCPPRMGMSCTDTTDTGSWPYIYTGAGAVLAAAGVVLLLAPNPAPAAPSTTPSTAAGDATTLRRAPTGQGPRALGVGLWGQGLTLSGQF